MRWKKVEGSGGIEDRRGEPSSGGGLGGGMGGGMGLPPLGKAGGGLGLVVTLVVIALFLLSQCGGAGNGDSGLTPNLDPGPAADSTSAPPQGDTATEFTKFVNKDVQDYWQQIFTDSGKTLHPCAGRALLERDGLGVRACLIPDRPVLLPCRQEGVSRSRVLQPARTTIWRAG